MRCQLMGGAPTQQQARTSMTAGMQAVAEAEARRHSLSHNLRAAGRPRQLSTCAAWAHPQPPAASR